MKLSGLSRSGHLPVYRPSGYATIISSGAQRCDSNISVCTATDCNRHAGGYNLPRGSAGRWPAQSCIAPASPAGARTCGRLAVPNLPGKSITLFHVANRRRIIRPDYAAELPRKGTSNRALVAARARYTERLKGVHLEIAKQRIAEIEDGIFRRWFDDIPDDRRNPGGKTGSICRLLLLPGD